MSSVLTKVQEALHLTGSIPHEAPKIIHRKKILLAISSAKQMMVDHVTGWFWPELLHAYEVFSAAGWDCDVVSETGTGTVDEASVGSLASATEKAKWTDKEFPLHAKLAAMRPAQSVLANLNDYAAIYYAGGHACCIDLPKATMLQQITARIYESGGVVGSDCHGIAIFDGLRLSNGQPLIQGKKITGFSRKGEEQMKLMDWLRQNGYSTMEEVVTRNGGVWTEHESDPWADYSQSSDRVVTGMNPASAASVAKAMLAYLPKDGDLKPATTVGDKSTQQTEVDKTRQDYQTGSRVNV
jgi:putative intracellular protease/amidase